MILYKRDGTKFPEFLLIDKYGKKSKKTKKKIILRRKGDAKLRAKDGEIRESSCQQDRLLGRNAHDGKSANATVEPGKDKIQAGEEASKTQDEIEMENKITEYEEVKKRIFGGQDIDAGAALGGNRRNGFNTSSEMEGGAAAVFGCDDEREAKKQVNFRDIQDDLHDPDFIRDPTPQQHGQVGGMYAYGHVNNHIPQFVRLPQQQMVPPYLGMPFPSNLHPQMIPALPIMHSHPAMMQPYMPIQRHAYPMTYNPPPPPRPPSPYMYPMYNQHHHQQQQYHQQQQQQQQVQQYPLQHSKD